MIQLQLCLQSPLTYKLIVLEGALIGDRRYLEAEEGFYDLQQAVRQLLNALLCRAGGSSAFAGLAQAVQVPASPLLAVAASASLIAILISTSPAECTTWQACCRAQLVPQLSATCCRAALQASIPP